MIGRRRMEEEEEKRCREQDSRRRKYSRDYSEGMKRWRSSEIARSGSIFGNLFIYL